MRVTVGMSSPPASAHEVTLAQIRRYEALER
jgi:hypothetical protein